MVRANFPERAIRRVQSISNVGKNNIVQTFVDESLLGSIEKISRKRESNPCLSLLEEGGGKAIALPIELSRRAFFIIMGSSINIYDV